MKDTHLWRRVIATKYSEEWSGQTSKPVRRTHGFSIWESIRAGWDRLLHYVYFDVGDGNRVWFWQDIWSGDHPLKVLFPDQYACSIARDASVYSVLVSQIDGGCRAGMSDFIDFNDWELELVNSFLNLLYSNIPKREGCDRRSWRLEGLVNLMFVLFTLPYEVPVQFLPHGNVFGVLRLQEGLLCMDSSLGKDPHM